MKAKKKESYASIFSAMVEQWNELQLIASFSTFLTDFEDAQISAADDVFGPGKVLFQLMLFCSELHITIMLFLI